LAGRLRRARTAREAPADEETAELTCLRGPAIKKLMALAGCEVFAAAMHDPVRVTQARGGEGGAALINLAAGCVTAQPLGRDQGGAETAERVEEPVSGGRSNAR
jgi:hypothetical protein